MSQKTFDRAETVELLSIPRDEEPLGPNSSSEDGTDLSDRTGVQSTRKHRKKRKTENWKRSLYLGSLSSIIVLLFNVSFVAWAVSHHDLTEDRGVLYTGDCTKTKRMSTGIHLVINILSTALLCASSYTMQCLCAPTRAEIDRAHQKNQWLDIGVPSMRNLFRISKMKLILWLILALSSLPLHLFYNSTIFSTITNLEYEIFAGNKPFSDFNANNVRPPHDFIDKNNTMYTNPYFSFSRMLDKGLHNELYRLENADCMSAYATNFQSEYGSVLLLTDDFHPNDTDFDFLSIQGASTPVKGNNPYAWMCCNQTVYACDMQTLCRDQLPEIRTHVDNWIVGGYRVNYCLAEKVPGNCKLEYSLPLAIIVIVFNTVKAIIICAVALTMTDLPILTTGDALASFLKTPEIRDRDHCLMTKALAKNPPSKPLPYKAKPQRWATAVSTVRWIICIICYTIAIAICIGLLCFGLSQITNKGNLWSGLGITNTETLISGNTWPPSLLTNTIIANTPQIIFSVLYFTSNSVLTTMTLAAEWSNYALHRKGLRVSSTPQGSQRTTYFLSLPYTYAIPLLIFSTVLHWLISQSLFLVNVETYDMQLERFRLFDFATCGYSPVAIVCAIVVGGVMVFGLVGLGFRRFGSGMPVAGSCSLAIAAACYPGVSSVDGCGDAVETMPLRWGVVYQGTGDGVEVGCCGFSGGEVGMPVDGMVYR
ncbi:unnamed protein product [Aspergillus oryzae RIB40]|uniref:DNA, SC103 n=2 Tax=Aspergillus oryzae TaxID=5062 RepID=Q2TYH5_ASPOR|nr:unnamed protein product [Aspergillus oryzae RIB40]OOO08097.1 hypothetical protein OAory_01045970 [Aspergillus oryzae]BAE65698.1 unnamed protein product [Aspergillus oryzae RIB40]